MFSRIPNPRLNRGRIASGATFSPLSLDQGGTLAMWLTPFDATYYALESGSAADLRRVDSLTNRGSLGGTMAQGTSADKPVLATYPEGRCLFNAGGSDRVEYSGTVTDFNFLAAGPWTIFLPLLASVNATSVLLDQTNGAGTNVGLRLRRLSNNLEVGIATGAVLNTISFTNALLGWTTSVKRVALTYDGANVTCYVNGAQVGSPTALTAGTPPAILALALGAHSSTGTSPFTGYVPEVAIYNRVLSSGELAQMDTYLSRHVLTVTYDQLVTNASLWELVAFFHSNGSAWVDRLGTYTVTEVGSPTHGTSAAFNNKNVMTLPSGANYAHFDALGSLFDGNDTSISVITAVELDALAAVQAMFSVGGSVNGHYYYHASDATPQWRATRFAGASAPSVLAGTATTAAGVRGLCFRATSGAGTASLYDGTTRIAELSAQDVGSCSFNQAATGVRRHTSNDIQAAGDYGAQVISTQFLNQGDYTLVQRALSVEFGL